MANDNVDRMAVEQNQVNQLTVPPMPELSIESIRNPMMILKYNRDMEKWRKDLERAISQLPLTQDNS